VQTEDAFFPISKQAEKAEQVSELLIERIKGKVLDFVVKRKNNCLKTSNL
jgi:hypothetical protein